MTLPTKLSVLRILLAFLIIGCLFLSGATAKVIALIGFLLASLTDWLDGYLARRWHQTSSFGALIDPIADKILVLGVFLSFVYLGLVPWWMALVIVAREVLVTAIRLFAARHRVVLAASREGKQKMVSQVVSIIMVLVVLLAREWPTHAAMLHPVRVGLERAMTLSLWTAVGFTVLSGSIFFWRHRAILRSACGWSETR